MSRKRANSEDDSECFPCSIVCRAIGKLEDIIKEYAPIIAFILLMVFFVAMAMTPENFPSRYVIENCQCVRATSVNYGYAMNYYECMACIGRGESDGPQCVRLEYSYCFGVGLND